MPNKPYQECPWLIPKQPDITPELKDLTKNGAWFCCHVYMGECKGAKLMEKVNGSLVSS